MGSKRVRRLLCRKAQSLVKWLSILVIIIFLILVFVIVKQRAGSILGG